MPENSTGSPASRHRLLAGNSVHNALVLSQLLDEIPWPLAILLAAAGAVSPALLQPRPLLAAIILGASVLGDLALLLGLPRLHLSYGPARPPLLLFAWGRGVVAVLVGLLPLPAPGSTLLLLGAQLCLGAVAAWAALVEPFRLEESEVTLPAPGLAGRLRLALLTDLHLERRTRREAAVLAAVARGRPDVILVGGDLLNLSYVGEPLAMAEARWFLGQLAAPAGVFVVRGTPEVDPRAVVDEIVAGLPLTLLEDQASSIEHGGARLTLLGVPADGSPAELAARLSALAASTQTNGVSRAPRLCLHHTPDLFEEAARLGLELYLAGHTHGGQICAPLVGPLVTASRFGRRYARGCLLRGATHGYVSRGLGLEGLGAPRLRFLARPELVWITLVDEPDRG